MSSEESQPAVYQRVLEGIAAESADVARRRDERREWLRDDPSWAWARHELAEDSGELREFNTILRELQTRHNAETFDPLEFAQWLWRMHIQTNEWRSDSTGTTKRAASGAHHASHVALDAVSDVTGFEYEDYAGDRQEVRS